MKAHLKRSEIPIIAEPEKTLIHLGPFTIDEEGFDVQKNNQTIDLKPKEFKIFLYLAKHPNQILSKEQICDAVWGEDYFGFDNTVMVHIRKLREKIEEDPSNPKFIIMVKGLGYKFVAKGN